MLNIKTIKKLLMLAVALVMLFTAAFFCCNTNLAALAQGEPTAEEVDDYLRDNGYSEEFIAQAGQETKLNLYEKGAKFESSAPIVIEENVSPMSTDYPGGGDDDITGPWDGFSATFTISDISDESIDMTKKILTLTWRWINPGNIGDHTVVFAWTKGYSVLEETALFEVSGDWVEVYREYGNPGFVFPPVQMSGTFSPMTRSGLNAIMYDYIDENGVVHNYTREVGAGINFSIGNSVSLRQRVYFGTNSFIDYELDLSDIQGSYSVEIRQYDNNNNEAQAWAYYYRSMKKIDFALNLGINIDILPPDITLSANPEISIEDYYQVAGPAHIPFNFYNEELPV